MSEREQKRARKKAADKLMMLTPGKLEPVDMSKASHPEWMTRAFRNNRYCVMIADSCPMTIGPPAIKAMIQRHDDKPIPNHWSEIQKIKNELFGPDKIAIEYFPAQSRLVDVHNIYWIFIFDYQIPEPLNP